MPPPPKSYATLPLTWAVVVLAMTLTPARDMPRTPHWELLSFDTAAHAGVFAVLAALSWFSLRRQRRWPRLAARTGWVVLAGCVAFGALIEVLQYAMHQGRHAEWTDLLGDSLGAALALLLAAGLARRRAARPPLALLFLLALAAPVARAQAPTLAPAQTSPPPLAEPDIARARRTIERLASPELHGRGYVQGGEHLAAAYLRGRLRKLGLQPLAPNYSQPFELDVNTFPGKVELTVIPEMEGANRTPYHLRLGADFIVAPESGAAGSPFVATLTRLDTAVFTSSAAQQAMQQAIRRAAGVRPLRAALVLTAKEEQRLKQLPAALVQTLDSAAARIVLVSKLTASLAPAQLPTVRMEALAALPVWAATSRNLRHDFSIAQIQLDAQLLRNYQTQNLAAVVRGRTQPDSFLVVTAHYDHLGMMGKTVYFPGANDNASGVALLLELAAHYARPENRPACSVVFLLFGAEEAGLVGSSYFVAHPLVPLPRIKFLVNLDLLGTGEEGATVVNGKLLPAAFQRLAALNDARHYLPRLTARGPAANSDHYPFSRAGVPAFFLYTRGGSLAYHDVNDRPAALSLAGFAGAFGLVRDFLDGLGGR